MEIRIELLVSQGESGFEVARASRTNANVAQLDLGGDLHIQVRVDPNPSASETVPESSPHKQYKERCCAEVARSCYTTTGAPAPLPDPNRW
jgi:hypothetical protein